MEGKDNAMSVKLLIDSKLNKVLFAEASKSFVDFLFYLLSLPVGTVINLLTTKSMVGSIGNLYKSFSDLNETYLQPNLHKNILLNPKPPSNAVANVPLLIGSGSEYEAADITKKFFTCVPSSDVKFRGPPRYCYKSMTDACNSPFICIYCLKRRTHEMTYIASSSDTTSVDSKGYVQVGVSYMISDDSCVTPMPMISSISMMNKFKVTQLDVLQEMEVEVGTKEALELLKASFQSTSVLTDVFLSKKNKSFPI